MTEPIIPAAAAPASKGPRSGRRVSEPEQVNARTPRRPLVTETSTTIAPAPAAPRAAWEKHVSSLDLKPRRNPSYDPWLDKKIRGLDAQSPSLHQWRWCIKRRTLLGLWSVWGRIKHGWRLYHQEDRPQIYRILLLLLDPYGFSIWPRLLSNRGLSLRQKLGRVLGLLSLRSDKQPLCGTASEKPSSLSTGGRQAHSESCDRSIHTQTHTDGSTQS